jgi:hypothetical protein
VDDSCGWTGGMVRVGELKTQPHAKLS